MLNKIQQRVVNCNDAKILCLAGAGTGKTTVMISRISRLVDDRIDPNSILALTFTNVAAFEMKSRYEALHPGEDCPEFRTFHSFCYQVLSKDKEILKAIGYTTLPNVADEGAEKRIIKEAMMQTGLELSEKKLYGNEVLSQQEAYNLMMILKAADRLMKRKNVITFNMLSKSICDLFIKDDPLILKYKERFKYIFADEYQDTDKIQHAFVTSFTDSNLFVVGDALQTLYSFRGASSTIIKNLSENKDWTTFKLSKNYRSTKQICKYVNRFSKSYADESYRVVLEAEKQGPDVVLSSYDTSLYGRNETPDAVIDEILFEDTKVGGSSALLMRTNAEVEHVQEYLTHKNIPFTTRKTDTDACNLLKCTLDDTYSIDWLSSLLPTNSYSEYIRRSTIKGKDYTFQQFIQDFGSFREISVKADRICSIRKLCKEQEPIATKCTNILKFLGYSKVKVDLAEVVKSGNKLSDLIDKIIKELESYQSQASELYIGTVHSVKGLEYDNVYVLGPSGKTWRLNSEDNDNVFYVAITRAKTNLTVYFAQ